MLHTALSSEPGTHASTVHSAVAAFDPDDPDKVRYLTALLDQSSAILARSVQTRQNLGNANSPSIWPSLRLLWNSILSAHAALNPRRAVPLSDLSATLAKFTRNLVAAVPTNQQRAYENEPAIRNLLYHYTSYQALQIPSSYPATRMLVQALSNMITANDALSQQLWTTYMNLPEEQLILTRLFASPDPRTVSSAFVLVLNCVHDNADRMQLLVGSPRGPRICIALLDRIASLFEAEQSSDEGRAFDVGYEIFGRVIEAGFVAELYDRLAVEAEPIMPHQTTLLKVIDSYLHTREEALHEVSSSGRPRLPGTSGGDLLDMLTRKFLALSTYTQSSVRRALGSQDGVSPDMPRHIPSPDNGNPAPSAEVGTGTVSNGVPETLLDGVESPLSGLDLLLPKVCEAFVLVTQALTTIALRAEEAASAGFPKSSESTTASTNLSPKAVIVGAVAETGQGLVESLIGTLRLVEALVPRITYSKVIAPDQRGFQGLANLSEANENNGGGIHGDAAATAPSEARDVKAGQAFAYVKRDLVRLLGILAEGNRQVQDRVRECGGIPVVMNLCVVDDYNPYLREHAIFALRNILYGNLENQAVVEAIQPVGRWDENRVLQEIRSGADLEL